MATMNGETTSGGKEGLDESTIARLLKETETALQTLHRDDKREYETASELVPHLVLSETPTLRFLRTDDYNPVAAAKRLALYWKYRKEVFGERWLLPLVQTGRGALTVPDILFLRTGHFFCYPFNQENVSLIHDFSRLNDFMETAMRNKWDVENVNIRINMYWATVVAEWPACQARGITLIHLVNSQQRPLVPFRVKAWDIVRTALPCKINKIVVAQAYERDKQELLEFTRVHTATIVGHSSGLLTLQVCGDSVSQTLQALHSSCGLPVDLAPISLGGGLDVDAKLAEWTRTRLSLEAFTDVSPTTFDAPSSNRPFAAAPVHPKNRVGVLVTRNSAQAETELEFNKRRGAVYARRTYYKQKNLLLSLQEEAKTWEGLNAHLRQEQKRLEQLILEANALLAGFCSTASTTMETHAIFPPQNGLMQYPPQMGHPTATTGNAVAMQTVGDPTANCFLCPPVFP